MAKFEVCISTEIDGANVPVEADAYGLDADGRLFFYSAEKSDPAKTQVRAAFARGKWVYFARLDE